MTNALHFCTSGNDTDRPLRPSAEGAGPLDVIDSVAVITMERITSIFLRIRRWGRPEAARLERVLPLLLYEFFPPRQVIYCFLMQGRYSWNV